MGARASVRGHALASIGGAALAASLWLPWYTFRLPSFAVDSAVQSARQLGALGPLVAAGAQYLRQLGPLHVTAWQIFGSLPAVLLVCAAIGGGLALLSLTERASGVAPVTAVAGVVALVLIVIKLVSPPFLAGLLHPAWGLFVALGGALAMTVGGALAHTDAQRLVAEPVPLGPSPAAPWTAGSVPPPGHG
jgi:hypothetical protein